MHARPNRRMEEKGRTSCRVGNFCCCIDLRLGVVVIACIMLVWDALWLIWMSYLAYHSYTDDEYAREVLQHSDVADWTIAVAGAFLTTIVSAGLFSLAFILDTLLLTAAVKARRKLLRGWLVLAVMYGLSLVAYWLNVRLFFRDSEYAGDFFTAGVIQHAGLMAYFWIVVRSYYLQLGQEHSDGRPRSTANKDNFNMAGKAMVPPPPPYYISTENQLQWPSFSDTKSLLENVDHSSQRI